MKRPTRMRQRGSPLITGLGVAAVSLFCAIPGFAQSEDQLRSVFEGQTIVLKIEMPGAAEGVDVYPGTEQPIDFPNHASRLKRFGTAYRAGDRALITKVKVKSDLIEFQLGAGGFGTFGDDASSHIDVPSAPRSQREKNLEKDLTQVTDPAQKKRIREELDALRGRRQREDARNRAEAAQAEQLKAASIRQRRMEGGSRFNLRYRPSVPPEAVSPEAVMSALAQYVDFTGLATERRAAVADGNSNRDLPRKGMSLKDVDAMLGRPDAITSRLEGSLNVTTSTYRTRDHRINAEFVEGVLIRFTITSLPEPQ